jgi:hypothetical protein
MSRYNYAGPFTNPAENMGVFYDEEDGLYYPAIKKYCDCGCPNCKSWEWTKKPNTEGCDDPSDIIDGIEADREFFENDYDQYLEENHYELARMDAYEMWRNEY